MISLFIIHLGEHFPHYIKDCIHQIRLHNPKETVDLYLIVNCTSNFIVSRQLEEDYAIKPVYVEDLPISPIYEEFLAQSKAILDLGFRQKYSQYILERYFVWNAFLQTKDLKNTYFIESDNLLYVDLRIVQKTEALFTQEMAMPFDTVERGAPSFVFARNQQALQTFTTWIVTCMKKGMTDDMDIYGLYRRTHPEAIFPYPVLPAVCNTNVTERKNRIGQTVSVKDCTFLCDERFPVIFDSVVYGQAISGIDPRNTNAQQSVGYINEKALFSVVETQLGWTKSDTLWVPVANTLPIVNLHIHSKALANFVSDRTTVPKADYDPKELLKKINQDYAT
jgi:hypothetical protein